MVEKAKKTNETPEDAKLEEILAAESLPETEAPEIVETDYKAVINELNDKVLRAMAETQNMRRRADIDIQNAKNFSIQSFAKDLLGVMDNLYRATDTVSEEDAATNPKLKTIKDGVEITKKEMTQVFERSGIKRLSPLGEQFDPNLHQAISQVADANAAPGTVLQVLQDGYILKDRLLRPALVVVAKAE
jgi:molecular chaperone GrpE